VDAIKEGCSWSRFGYSANALANTKDIWVLSCILVEHKSYYIEEEFCEIATLGPFSQIMFDDREAEKG
jgi:hypothetical protein